MDHHGEEFVPPKNRPMTAIVHSPTDEPQLIFEDENIKVDKEKRTLHQRFRCFWLVGNIFLRKEL